MAWPNVLLSWLRKKWKYDKNSSRNYLFGAFGEFWQSTKHSPLGLDFPFWRANRKWIRVTHSLTEKFAQIELIIFAKMAETEGRKKEISKNLVAFENPSIIWQCFEEIKPDCSNHSCRSCYTLSIGWMDPWPLSESKLLVPKNSS